MNNSQLIALIFSLSFLAISMIYGTTEDIDTPGDLFVNVVIIPTSISCVFTLILFFILKSLE